jgi:putative transposase
VKAADRLVIVYKFRLYPTPTQERTLNNTLETCRRLYNSMLTDRKENNRGFYEQKRALTVVRKGDKFLKAVQSHVLQDVALRLDKACGAFFAGLSRYPRFRRRGRYNSLTYDYTGFSLRGDRVRLSMIGAVKIVVHRPLLGRVKRLTVIRDIDQWFASFSVEQDSVEERNPVPKEVGIDLGISNIVALSDGTLVENPRCLSMSTSRILYLQREFSRKKKGSKNRERAKVRLAKAWRKVRRQRDDFGHKLSHELVEKNGLMVFENLKVRNMVKNHSLASAIMDASWSNLRQLTVYKAERRGGRVILVNPEGTSQKCSRCGVMNPKMEDLSERIFRCEVCGLVLDRDVNAARNLLQAGQELARVEAKPLLVQRRRISKFADEAKSPQLFRRG